MSTTTRSKGWSFKPMLHVFRPRYSRHKRAHSQVNKRVTPSSKSTPPTPLAMNEQLIEADEMPIHVGEASGVAHGATLNVEDTPSSPSSSVASLSQPTLSSRNHTTAPPLPLPLPLSFGGGLGLQGLTSDTDTPEGSPVKEVQVQPLPGTLDDAVTYREYLLRKSEILARKNDAQVRFQESILKAQAYQREYEKNQKEFLNAVEELHMLESEMPQFSGKKEGSVEGHHDEAQLLEESKPTKDYLQTGFNQESFEPLALPVYLHTNEAASGASKESDACASQ